MATSGERDINQRRLRMMDVEAESSAMNTPITDYQNMPTISYDDTPIVSLEKAVEPLVPLIPDVGKYASDAKKKCQNPPADGLTLDESASIRLYSMEWPSNRQSVYIVLNITLRSKDKEKLQPWFRYLKLLLTGLERLPSKHRMVYRGVKANLHGDYPKDGLVIWWPFSSCAKTIGVLSQEAFLGKTGDRTMFHIECESGKDIQKHSAFPAEREILLLAGTQFEVIDSLEQNDGLNIIQLQEIKPSVPLLRSLLGTNSKSSSSESVNLSASNKSQCLQRQAARNVSLIWLDSNIDLSKGNYRKSIEKLKAVVSKVDTFTDSQECKRFLADTDRTTVSIIISGSLGEHVVPTLHEMDRITAIFIFCGNKKRHEQWAKAWPKIKGVFTELTPICEALAQLLQQLEYNATPIRSAATGKRADRLDPSYMYTQILKEILLTIKFDQRHIQEYADYCREGFCDDEEQRKYIKQLEQHYRDNTPIWWYTCECFLYPMVNRAIRVMDGDIMTKMGFFINDLHRHIEQVHREQYGGRSSAPVFTVYRGQGLSKADFDQLLQIKGGLMSFNSFLSTNKIRQVSLSFAKRAASNPDLIGVLFVMKVDPAQVTTPFASIREISAIPDEEVVLFAMHSVFRVHDIKSMDGSNQLYEVHLSLTSDSDQELRALTDRIREESCPDEDGWYRLGLVLYKMGQLEKAEETFKTLLGQARNENERAPTYHQLGLIKYDQGEYREAIIFYEKSLAIQQRSLPPTHPDLATSYNNIGLVYGGMGDYPKALSYYERALAIQKQSLPSTHPALATSYNNIGLVYDGMGHYTEALSSYEKALAIRQQSLPPTHPALATSYNNIGLVYDSMGDYPKALSYYERALAIQKQSLPPTHPDLATSYNDIGEVYENMGDYAKACSFLESSVKIAQQALPSNHPNLQKWRKNLERIKKKL